MPLALILSMIALKSACEHVLVSLGAPELILWKTKISQVQLALALSRSPVVAVVRDVGA